MSRLNNTSPPPAERITHNEMVVTWHNATAPQALLELITHFFSANNASMAVIPQVSDNGFDMLGDCSPAAPKSETLDPTLISALVDEKSGLQITCRGLPNFIS